MINTDTFPNENVTLIAFNGPYITPKAIPRRIEYKKAVDC